MAAFDPNWNEAGKEAGAVIAGLGGFAGLWKLLKGLMGSKSSKHNATIDRIEQDVATLKANHIETSDKLDKLAQGVARLEGKLEGYFEGTRRKC